MQLIFRYDDYSALPREENFRVDEAVFQLFLKLNIPLVAGVTPRMSACIHDPANLNFYNFEDDVKRVNLLSLGLKQGWQIALHGFNHQKASPAFETEFAKQAELIQSSKIKEGLEILDKCFPGIPIDLFIPPWNSIDERTIKCLAKAGFTRISSGADRQNFFEEGVTIIPSLMTLRQFMDFTRVFSIDDLEDLMGDSSVVITMHGFEFIRACEKNSVSFMEFSSLLEQLAKRVEISIIPQNARKMDFNPKLAGLFKAKIDLSAKVNTKLGQSIFRAADKIQRVFGRPGKRIFLNLSAQVFLGLKKVCKSALKKTSVGFRKAKSLGYLLVSGCKTLAHPLASRRLHRCPICGYFGPFGTNRDRPHSFCLRCGSLERHRFIHYVLRQELGKRLFKGVVLVVAPDKSLTDLLKGYTPRSVITSDLFRDDVDLNFNLEKIPFPDNYFEMIMAVHVFTCVDDDVKAIQECYRVLAEGGWLLAPVHVLAGEKTVELHQRRPDGQIRVAGQNYEERFIEAGFKKAALFSSSDFPYYNQLYQFRLYRYGEPASDEELVIYVK